MIESARLVGDIADISNGDRVSRPLERIIPNSSRKWAKVRMNKKQ